jgi:SAM-dependent methyltransferase
MRDHNKAFCRLAAETFDCPGPVCEFGSYQVEGQEEYADLRRFFPGKPYVGCDFRAGPGVDRIEDVTATTLPDGSVGTVLCIETFEHVFQVWKAFDEVYRILRPGGLFVLTSPFHFRIHGYPDDYWRMTPSCLRRMLAPFGGRLVGAQGHEAVPHTVMALAAKSPASVEFAARAQRLEHAYHAWLARTRQELPVGQKLRRGLGMLYRSKGERHQLADYYKASFTIEATPTALARVG